MSIFHQYLHKVFIPKLMSFPSRRIRNWLVKRYFGKIGENVSFLRGSGFVAPNTIFIGNNCVFNKGVFLDGRGGKLIIGDNVDIGRETNIWTLEHDVNDDNHSTIGADTIIEDYVWISTRCTILPGGTFLQKLLESELIRLIILLTIVRFSNNGILHMS